MIQNLWICASIQQCFDAKIYICKGLITYYKFNGITPMNIRVQIAHPKFFAHEKQLKEKVIECATHTWQLE
jgi:hypothetical protein